MKNVGSRVVLCRSAAFVSACLCLLSACKPQGAKQPGEAAPSAAPSGASSGSAAPAAADDPAVTRGDVQKLAARESDGLSPVDVEGPGKKWRFRAPAKGAAAVSAIEGGGAAEIPIGAGAPVHCEVLDGDFDAAGTIQNVVDGARDKVQIQRVAPTGVHVHKGDPSLFVNALYLATTTTGKAMGELKLAVLVTPGRAAVCLHDELGYEKTFGAVAEGVFESVTRTESPLAKATFREVSVAKVGPIAVGFEARRFVAVEGIPMLITTSAMVLPASETTVSFIDQSEVEKLGKDNLLEEGEYARATNGHVDMSAVVKRKKGAEYSFRVALGDKKAEGTFTVPGQKGLSTRAAEAKKLAQAVRTKGAFKWETVAYMPDLDPQKGTALTYERAATDPAKQISVSMGSQRVHGTVDEHGAFDHVEIPIGAVSLQIERAFVEGKL